MSQRDAEMHMSFTICPICSAKNWIGMVEPECEHVVDRRNVWIVEYSNPDVNDDIKQWMREAENLFATIERNRSNPSYWDVPSEDIDRVDNEMKDLLKEIRTAYNYFHMKGY